MNPYEYDRSWKDEQHEEPLWKAIAKGIFAVLLMCACVYLGLIAIDIHMERLEITSKPPIERSR